MDWITDAVHKGYLDTNDTHHFDIEISYKACPCSIEKIQKYIDGTKAIGTLYATNNKLGRNCAGWAAGALEAAGFNLPTQPQLGSYY